MTHTHRHYTIKILLRSALSFYSGHWERDAFVHVPKGDGSVVVVNVLSDLDGPVVCEVSNHNVIIPPAQRKIANDADHMLFPKPSDHDYLRVYGVSVVAVRWATASEPAS